MSIPPQRTVTPPPRYVRERRRCAEPGCDTRTRAAKPYCPQHVEQHPYVQRLQARLQNRDAEHSRVLRRGPAAIDPESPTTRDLIRYLQVNGPRTVRRIAKDLNLELTLATTYVEGLRRRGRLRTWWTDRERLAAELAA